MHDDLGQEARFQAVLDLTRALDGHLTCIGVAMPIFAGDYSDMSGTALLTTDAQREVRVAYSDTYRLVIALAKCLS